MNRWLTNGRSKAESLCTRGPSISQALQRKLGLNTPPPPNHNPPSLLETLTLASEIATCVVFLCASGEACLPVLLFLPSAPCAPWSVALASAHTEPTICPSLLFGARQMEREKKISPPQKKTNPPVYIFFSHQYNLLRRLMSRFIFCHVTLRLNELKIHSLEVANSVLVRRV